MSEQVRIIIMGVSGCGKSAVGQALATTVGARFVDADDHHSRENIAKMAAGSPLTDADRAAWLDTLAGILSEHDQIVLACSALKVAYRRRLRDIDGTPPTFLFLDGSFDQIDARLAARDGHYFHGRAMLQSQFETLEPPGPDEAVAVKVDGVPLDMVVQRCRDALRGVLPSD